MAGLNFAPTCAYLRNTGATPQYSAAVNGSTTPVEFSWTADGLYHMARMLVLIQDSGTFDAENYGNGIGLTNGIDVEFESDETIDMLDGVPVTTNADWGGLCYDINYIDIGQGDNYLLVRWTFEKSGMRIRMKPGDRFVVRINDDLTGLTDHRFHLQGHERSRRER